MEKIRQQVIPAIASEKEFERFLDSPLVYCVFLNINLSQLGILIHMAHKQGKKALVHMDLIPGISSDEAGCEYVCRRLLADGIISTKGKVVEMAKKNKKTAILRLFLIDSRSLEKGLALCQAVKPDYMEVLPGIACSILPRLQARVDVPLMSGGLIRTQEEIEACLQAGAAAVTISDIKTAVQFTERKQG